ncbi:MAG: N-acetyltransferase [Mediterranea sp.]|jgi:predicted GNAT family acetyltransferase|nr:N-acetyltransferase [Mediterranea sp.]
MEEETFVNNKKEKRYELHVDGLIAIVEYILTQGGEIFFTHTEVPARLTGKGVAARLTEQALQDVEQQGLKLIPLCPYTASYVKKHIEQWKHVLRQNVHLT